MGAKIIELGRHLASFGEADDPERIRKIVMRNNPYPYSMLRERVKIFDISYWPEGAREVELFAVSFDQPSFFARIDQLMRLLPPDYADLKKTTLPHFMCLLEKDAVEWLFTNEVRGVVLTDPGSLFNASAYLNLPHLTLGSVRQSAGGIHKMVSMRLADVSLPKETFFLFYRD